MIAFVFEENSIRHVHLAPRSYSISNIYFSYHNAV